MSAATMVQHMTNITNSRCWLSRETVCAYLKQRSKTVAPFARQCLAFTIAQIELSLFDRSRKKRQPRQVWMLPIHCALMELCSIGRFHIGASSKATKESSYLFCVRENSFRFNPRMSEKYYFVMPLASSTLVSLMPDIGHLLNNLSRVLRLQSTGAWLVAFCSLFSSSASDSPASGSIRFWLIRFKKVVASLVIAGFFTGIVSVALPFAIKLNTESSDDSSDATFGSLFRLLFGAAVVAACLSL